MSKEQMALAICESRGVADVDNCRKCKWHEDCLYQDIAFGLYKSGYRKQSEPISCSHENGDGWISVEERLPEDVYGKDRRKITVLVCTEGRKVSTATRQRRVKFDSTKLEWVELDTFEWSKRKRVTHWMPLPKVPKMKGGE